MPRSIVNQAVTHAINPSQMKSLYLVVLILAVLLTVNITTANKHQREVQARAKLQYHRRKLLSAHKNLDKHFKRALTHKRSV
jgi:sensor domain CHASE-containing protein